VADVVHGKNGAARYFLLNAEQPVRGDRVLRMLRKCIYVLRSRDQRRIGRRVVYRRLKEVVAVARECGYVGRRGKVEVHWVIEKPAVSVNDGLSLASQVPCETHARRPVTLRRGVCSLCGREKRLGGDIE